jgi:LacI family gluconate utilization system Gnt-I transcriptional repressor
VAQDQGLAAPGTAAARKPKLGDVAARAGVSTATVSRYINKLPLVSKAAGERIQAVIDELGYVPNLLAGALSSNRSRLVAVLVPGLSQSLFNPTIEAMVHALGQDGYTAMLGLSGNDDTDLNRLIDAALARSADGIILTGIVGHDNLRKRLKAAGTRIIETWGLPDNPIDAAVGFSHAQVGRAIAAYLARRGYSRPLLVTARGTRSAERRSGFVEEWQGSSTVECQEIEVESPSRFSQARLIFRAVRQITPRPDVIICGSDGLAQGILVEALAAGMSVPDELAVVGFGNLPVAADMRPSITTVAVDGERIGREAAAILMQPDVNSPTAQRTIDVGFSLIERESA